MDNELDLTNGSFIPNSLRYIDNDSPQRSIILRIVPHETPFEAGDTIVVGAHMDSINGKNLNMTPDGMIAPGADDNGSGTIVLLAVLSALGRLFAEKPVLNEVQFHWYGAEEVGLWGSKSVFETLKNESFRVKAMLNLDMVGYSGGHAPGFPKIALQEGYVDKSLTAFTAKLIEKVSFSPLRGPRSWSLTLEIMQYSQAQVGMASCGYPCSDHASAHMYGFPSAMIGESSYLAGNGNIPNGNPNIHSDTDTIETIDRDYMLEFAKVTAAFIVELAYTNFTTLETEANQAGGW